MFDAPFWALLGLILFFAIIIYMKVPRTITGSLDNRARLRHAKRAIARLLTVRLERDRLGTT